MRQRRETAHEILTGPLPPAYTPPTNDYGLEFEPEEGEREGGEGEEREGGEDRERRKKRGGEVGVLLI